MSTTRKRFGDWGEDQACQFLERKGFDVKERNFHATVGEIDIIARKNDDWYFIEVKTRRAGELANDLAITRAKKKKFEKTIKQYCFKRKIDGEVGLIMAGLMVVVDKEKKTVGFRLAVFC
jgi:putative endonuclease